MTSKNTLLWVDMNVSRKEFESANFFERYFDVQRHSHTSSLDTEIERRRPRVICFDFDFPTKPGLQTLQRAKHTHAQIPILMLTVQHSEALAVWAFRSRVWDYLVKPIAEQEVTRCLIGLREMLEAQDLRQPARKAARVQSLIPEENRLSARPGNAPLALAPAIEYVEKHYRTKISSKEAASGCSLTPFQFSRLFKETYNLTFQDYVLRFRIREACKLLRNPSAEIADVAFLVGFNDPSYFGKIFRRYMDCSPSQFVSANQGSIESELLEDLALEAFVSESAEN